MKAAAIVSFATTVVDATCPVTNPNPDTMNNVFRASWQNSKDNLDHLTHDNHGAQIFRDYVENCVHGDNPAEVSDASLPHASAIGGTTMFYNNKSASEHLDIYGGDLLVIPSQFFKVVNDAQQYLPTPDFHTLLAAMVESGLTKAINDGEKGKNNWPTENSVLMDSQGPGDHDYINFCLHLWPHVSVHWMHMHIYQDQAWNNSDLLWDANNTCTRIQKPDGGWNSLLEDQDSFQQKVNHLADLLVCNMGDGQAGNVQNFGNDSCPPSGVNSNSTTSSPTRSTTNSSTSRITRSPTSSTTNRTSSSTASSSASRTSSSTASSTTNRTNHRTNHRTNDSTTDSTFEGTTDSSDSGSIVRSVHI